MSSGESLQFLCILPFGVLCLSSISMMFVKSVDSVYIGGVMATHNESSGPGDIRFPVDSQYSVYPRRSHVKNIF